MIERLKTSAYPHARRTFKTPPNPELSQMTLRRSIRIGVHGFVPLRLNRAGSNPAFAGATIGQPSRHARVWHAPPPYPTKIWVTYPLPALEWMRWPGIHRQTPCGPGESAFRLSRKRNPPPHFGQNTALQQFIKRSHSQLVVATDVPTGYLGRTRSRCPRASQP